MRIDLTDNDIVGVLMAALGGGAVGVERQGSGHADGPGARFAGFERSRYSGQLAVYEEKSEETRKRGLPATRSGVVIDSPAIDGRRLSVGVVVTSGNQVPTSVACRPPLYVDRREAA